MHFKPKFDNEFQNFIYETRGLSRVVDIIDYSDGRYLESAGDYISVTNEIDSVSYIPASKLRLENSGFNEKKYRINIKIGRFVNKFIKKDIIQSVGITDYDIEIFVNLFKSYFDRDETKLKIVEGDDILKYYLHDNYHRPNGACIGTLWNSCMRYREKNRFMEIYAKNPNKVKMLVLLDDLGKVKTRALLWEDCFNIDGKSYKVMDRIYSVYDHDMMFFKSWAIKNGYFHKLEQSAKCERIFVGVGGVCELGLTTILENTDFEYYPYIDTFKFFSFKKKSLSNSERFSYKYILIQNDGSLEPSEELIEDDNWDDGAP